MSTRNYDSSLLTKNRQAMMVAGYYDALANAVADGQNVVGRQTAASGTTAYVVIEKNIGGCLCTTANSSTPYGTLILGGTPCGCAASR